MYKLAWWFPLNNTDHHEQLTYFYLVIIDSTDRITTQECLC